MPRRVTEPSDRNGKRRQHLRKAANSRGEDWLVGYRSEVARAAGVWDRINAFVLDHGTALGHSTYSPGGNREVKVLAELAAWAVTQPNMGLNPDRIFHPRTIEEYEKQNPWGRSANTHATYVSAMRRVARKRAPHLWPRKARPTPRQRLGGPYTEREKAWWRAQVECQTTDLRKRGLLAAVAMSFGCGFTGKSIPWVLPDDVWQTKYGAQIRTDDPERVVTVLAEYADDIIWLAEQAGDEFLIGGTSLSYNRCATVMKSTRPKGRPPFNPDRGRVNWLLHHATIGTRLPELMRAAAWDTPRMLEDVLRFVPSLSTEAEESMMRGDCSPWAAPHEPPVADGPEGAAR
jgi:hypothetical protein